MRAVVLILLFLALPARASDWRDLAERLGSDAALADACGLAAAERDDLALLTAVRLKANAPPDRLDAAQRLRTEHHLAALAIHRGTPPDCARLAPPLRAMLRAARPELDRLRRDFR